MKTNETGWKPGIVTWKDTALFEARIRRLGPPPGNAEVLIRGGAGWVLGVAPRKESLDSRIIKKNITPPSGEVSLAVAREMAWRWFYGHEPFTRSTVDKQRGSSMKERFPPRYEDAEEGFVTQMLNLPRGMSFTIPLELSYAAPIQADVKSAEFVCECLSGGTCCIKGNCQGCEEG